VDRQERKQRASRALALLVAGVGAIVGVQMRDYWQWRRTELPKVRQELRSVGQDAQVTFLQQVGTSAGGTRTTNSPRVEPAQSESPAEQAPTSRPESRDMDGGY
jgi:hypothetical protein